MKTLFKQLIFVTTLAAAGVASSAHAGTTYLFTVTCPNSMQVVEWDVGDIDPGEEFLRVSTGSLHPGCSVTDYRDEDAILPRTRHSHEAAIIEGIPVLGPILEDIFG